MVYSQHIVLLVSPRDISSLSQMHLSNALGYLFAKMLKIVPKDLLIISALLIRYIDVFRKSHGVLAGTLFF